MTKNNNDIVELTSQRYGNESSPSLIIMHGLFGSGRNWSMLARKFAEFFHVHMLDLRNHGASPHRETMNYEVMADDLAHFLDLHEIERASILGHSMGGKVAMWFALNHPDRVERLIAADIAPVSYQHSFDQILLGLKSIPLDWVNSRSDADEFLSEYLDEKPLRQFLLQNLVIQDGNAGWRINLAAIEKALPQILSFPDTGSVSPNDLPALFIAGGQSDYVLPEHVEVIEQLFPSARIENIHNAGHWLHAEQPDEFARVVKAFLL